MLNCKASFSFPISCFQEPSLSRRPHCGWLSPSLLRMCILTTREQNCNISVILTCDHGATATVFGHRSLSSRHIPLRLIVLWAFSETNSALNWRKCRNQSVFFRIKWQIPYLLYAKSQGKYSFSYGFDIDRRKRQRKNDETNTSSRSTGEIVNGTFMSSGGHHLLHIWVFLCTFDNFINAVK